MCTSVALRPGCHNAPIAGSQLVVGQQASPRLSPTPYVGVQREGATHVLTPRRQPRLQTTAANPNTSLLCGVLGCTVSERWEDTSQCPSTACSATSVGACCCCWCYWRHSSPLNLWAPRAHVHSTVTEY